LRELVCNLQERRVPKRAVVVTFDDGYADVLYHAKPLLERYQTPATVFVTTGYLGREFWWDKLERMLLSPATLPEQPPLPINDGSYDGVSNDPSRRPVAGSRYDLVRSLYRRLLRLSPPQREKAMVQLAAWSGTVPEDRSHRRALTADELIELAAGDLIDIGAHTVTHPVLAALSTAAQRSEIQESKRHLEELLGQPVASFAYPNGSSSQETLAIVRQSGFGCACSSDSDVASQRSDPFHLPRFSTVDWNGEAFSRWLGWWLAT
jgi:peptidoglycan/xylan/chitin deacetylase (PgdA/CDA1 family)